MHRYRKEEKRYDRTCWSMWKREDARVIDDEIINIAGNATIIAIACWFAISTARKARSWNRSMLAEQHTVALVLARTCHACTRTAEKPIAQACHLHIECQIINNDFTRTRFFLVSDRFYRLIRLIEWHASRIIDIFSSRRSVLTCSEQLIRKIKGSIYHDRYIYIYAKITTNW